MLELSPACLTHLIPTGADTFAVQPGDGLPRHQTTILINGAQVPYDGPRADVLGAIPLRTAAGTIERAALGSLPHPGPEWAQRALSAAVAAFDCGAGLWPSLRPVERARYLQAFASRLATRREEMVRWLMWEIGKARADAEKEFDRTIEYLQMTLQEAGSLANMERLTTDADGMRARIRRVPLGVVLCLGPYNYPFNETFATLLPALAMGNTVVLKVPKWGALLYDEIAAAAVETLPAGVLNFVYGDGAVVVPPLLQSGAVDVLAFIGSSRVGDALKKSHPKSNRLRAILGMDAKNAAIVLNDADLGLALRECVAGTLGFNGQRCTALKILFVQRRLADEFAGRFSWLVDGLTIGMPWDDGARITPLPDPAKPAYLAALVDDACSKGAVVVNRRHQAVANLVAPTVLYGVDARMRAYHEEQFGPLVPIVAFDDPAEPLAYLRDSSFGQQVSLFGSSSATLAPLVDACVHHVSRVNLNAQCQRAPDRFPFTGRKDSAEGTLSVFDALRAFSIRATVVARANGAGSGLLDNPHSLFLAA
jgi:glyceraldehyde-3-phosphate dehydrogenase (NADP+)